MESARQTGNRHRMHRINARNEPVRLEGFETEPSDEDDDLSFFLS